MKTQILAISLLLPSACGDSAGNADLEAVERQQRQYQESQPIPTFDFSLERDVAIQLYRARNERVATHTVWRSDTGIIEGDCPSIGYPLPYDTSLTNPLKPFLGDMVRHEFTVEQAEPNGLFASKNSIATWVRCIAVVNGKDVEAPIYIESKVTTYPYPVDVNYLTNTARPIAGKQPTVTID